MIEKKAHSVRGEVYYWSNDPIVNNDTAIVFCHGLTADHTLFDKQVEYLSDRYKLITWDIPLHGKSRPYLDFSYDNISADLLSILKSENVNNVILVGQSAGGYVAQAFIEKYSDMVLGFLGIGTTPFGKRYYKKSELFWIKHFTHIARIYPYSLYCKACVKSVAITSEARDSMLKTLVKLTKRGMLEAADAVYGEFLKRNNEIDFQCPIMITYGEFDKTGYVQKYCVDWAEKTGHSLKVISNASHNANYDNYSEFNSLLNSFIESIINKK